MFSICSPLAERKQKHSGQGQKSDMSNIQERIPCVGFVAPRVFLASPERGIQVNAASFHSFDFGPILDQLCLHARIAETIEEPIFKPSRDEPFKAGINVPSKKSHPNCQFFGPPERLAESRPIAFRIRNLGSHIVWKTG